MSVQWLSWVCKTWAVRVCFIDCGVSTWNDIIDFSYRCANMYNGNTLMHSRLDLWPALAASLWRRIAMIVAVKMRSDCFANVSNIYTTYCTQLVWSQCAYWRVFFATRCQLLTAQFNVFLQSRSLTGREISRLQHCLEWICSLRSHNSFQTVL